MCALLGSGGFCVRMWNKSHRLNSPALRLCGCLSGCPAGCGAAPPGSGSVAGASWAERLVLQAAALHPRSPSPSDLQRTQEDAVMDKNYPLL